MLIYVFRRDENMLFSVPEVTLRKISEIHLISHPGIFAEGHSYRGVLGESSETLRKLHVSAKFPHQEIN